MQTCFSSKLVSNPSSNPNSSTNPNPKGRNRRRSKQRIEEFNLDELSPPIVMMAHQRTMAQLLQAPTGGYEDAIVVPAITTNNFELKHGLLTVVQNKQFFGHAKEDSHAHIRYFNKITSTLKFSNVLNTFKDLLRACPHHGFSELHQLDTFYNALNSKDQDSLNSAAGGNFLEKMPRECLAIIESKSKVHYSSNKPVVAKVSMNSFTSGISPDVDKLKDMVKALLLDKKSENQAPAIVKAVEGSSYVKAKDAVIRNMQTQGQNMQNQLTNLTELLTKFVNSNNASTSSSGTLHRNTIANRRSDLKAITTKSGVSYDGSQIPSLPSFLPKVVENEPEATKDTPVNSPTIELVSSPRPNQRPSIPYPSRLQDQKLHAKFGPSIKSLLTNKDKLCELARTPLNEHYSMVLLNKLPEKLGDPDKFLIPYDFPEKAECLALADLGGSINLMPLSVWNKLSLLDLTPTCMTLELTDHFDADPRVPLILGRSFLKTERALIDVFEGDLTLHVGKEAITFNLDQTSRYSANYNDMTAKRIDLIDMACEEYSQEVLGFSNVIVSGNPTPYYDLIVSSTSLTLTPFRNSDFLLEEVDAFLALEDNPTLSEVDQSYLDSKGDILLLEAFLNKDPSLPPPNQGNYLSKVELKDLPTHLEYAFLEDDDKLPVIIAKDLSMEENSALITVLKSHKRAIAWKLSDIKGIDPKYCTHKILMEEDFEPVVQHQRSVNPKIHDVIKQELNEATREDHFPLPFLDQLLERLAGNQYSCFLDGFSGYFQIPIDPKDQEKTTFTCPYGMFAYRCMPFGQCNASGMFHRCMMAIFHDMIEKTMEVFMDDFSVFKNSFQSCLSHLEKMLKRCEETNLCLNWEKSYFMVKEGIVLGHKISKQGIEVDKAKVDVITKLPHPTTVMGIRSFLGHAGF
uniref:Reverse transcriptase domain-containing protein n=1 Tax=Tanacetum cinerariifolium TaxID=118510 RepID=A0A699GV27_TANCI|nr:reverse transcriptase domain-containing protein [Tanacetum cinerariifolium]